MRVFKTRNFAAAATKADISDAELCAAVKEVMNGQAADLGGGVWKKRLNKNLHRSIILAKGSNYWVYQFLFAKNNSDNISDKELTQFKKLAKIYEKLSSKEISDLVKKEEFQEICNG